MARCCSGLYKENRLDSPSHYILNDRNIDTMPEPPKYPKWPLYLNTGISVIIFGYFGGPGKARDFRQSPDFCQAPLGCGWR